MTRIFQKPIQKTHITTGSIAGIALALLISVFAMHDSRRTFAAGDEVCGDASLDAGEQCDDGNLKNGDGCSNVCTTEVCGNAIVDANEQCDDGNAIDGDGCNQYCQIEFCGDKKVQTKLGEDCDDGNGVGDDGCSSQCTSEVGKGIEQVEKPVLDANEQKELSPTPEQTAAQVLAEAKKLVQNEVKNAATFLTTQDGEDITKYFSREESIQLEQIITKLQNGRRLTAEEREWAATIVQKLQDAKVLERTRYTDLLKQFIATPISSDVVDEKDLQKQKLVDVEVPVAIAELHRAVGIIRRGELQGQVTADLTKLKRQGIDTEAVAPESVTKNLSSKRPIEVFASLKALKESSESFATTDVSASLERIRAEASALEESLPLFEREYGVNVGELTALLGTVHDVSKEVTKQDVYRVVSAVNRLLEKLQRDGVVSKAELASYTQMSPHAAAGAVRIAESLGEKGLVTANDLAGFVATLADTVPEKEKKTFSEGSEDGQSFLLSGFLANDERVQAMRRTLREDGRDDFELRYQELQRDIRAMDGGLMSASPCDDGVPAALQCVSQYLVDLQEAVRGRSTYARVIGYFQDLFGIQ